MRAVLFAHPAWQCPQPPSKALAAPVVERWSTEALPARRLTMLAGGVCAALPAACGRALATVADLPFDPAWPPPYAALAERARR